MRNDIVPPSILRANSCLQGVDCDRHTTGPSWEENVGSSSPDTFSLSPILNVQVQLAKQFSHAPYGWTIFLIYTTVNNPHDLKCLSFNLITTWCIYHQGKTQTSQDFGRYMRLPIYMLETTPLVDRHPGSVHNR